MSKLFGAGDDGLTDLYMSNILSKVCKHFEGCYSCNTIPNQLHHKKKASIIVNLAPLELPGTHFVTVILKSDKIIYIDSLGKPCENGYIYNFMSLCQRPIYMNDIRVQHPLSSYCGFFCMATCLYHDEERNFLLDYSNDLYKNDELAVLYVMKMIEMKHLK